MNTPSRHRNDLVERQLPSCGHVQVTTTHWKGLEQRPRLETTRQWPLEQVRESASLEEAIAVVVAAGRLLFAIPFAQDDQAVLHVAFALAGADEEDDAMREKINYRRELPTGGYIEVAAVGSGECFVRRWRMADMPDHVRLDALLGAVTHILRACLSAGPPGARVVSVTFDVDALAVERIDHRPS